MRLLPASLWPRFLKRRLPTSLWGRSLLIIVLPVLVMQVAVTWAFFDMHWQTVTARLSDGLAGDIAWAAESWRDDPTPDNMAVISERAERSMSLSVQLREGDVLPDEDRRGPIGVVDRTLEKALATRIDQPFWFDTTRYPAYVDIRVQQPQGVLRIIAPRERAVATQAHIFVLWLTIATVLLMSVAILFIRNQVRAIERLAEAAEAFGKGGDVADFKPYGAREVRQAAQAFLAMKSRIQRHLEQRTAMLASVSHDLRTPLTRLRLEAEMSVADEAARQGIVADIEQMEAVISQFMDHARAESGEQPEVTDLAALLAGIGERQAAIGRGLEIDLDGLSTAKIRPRAVGRAVVNLLDNAWKYGGGAISLKAVAVDHEIRIEIADRGPGIPEADMERLKRPFTRLENARTDASGTGLGLAIVERIARLHGGRLELLANPGGGLLARLVLSLL